MADDEVVLRPLDGSPIDGLTRSKWKHYLEKYSYLSADDLFQIVYTFAHCFDEEAFLRRAGNINAEKEAEKKYGKLAPFTSSLFMLLSVHVKPLKSSSLSVFGEITSVSGYHPDKHNYIYKTESRDVQCFSDAGGYLTLNGPPEPSSQDEACFLFRNNNLSIRLYDQTGRLLIDDDSIIFNYSEDSYERVDEKKVVNGQVSLTFKYVSIPMAVTGYLNIRINKRNTNPYDFLNVSGKVVAKYKNTFGNYGSEEIVLFDKDPQSHQYEKITQVLGSNLLFWSRCWVAAPAYSSLLLDIDLFDSGNGEKIISTKGAELETSDQYGYYKDFVSGEYLVSLYSSWYDSSFLPPKQDCFDDQISRSLGKWTMESAIEVYSVLVCYKECTQLKIVHGHLQFIATVSTDDFVEKGFDIFKIKKEEPLTLVGSGNTIPLLNDGSRVLHCHLPVSIVCDLKDTGGGLNIRGSQIISEDLCFDRQLCSVFQGDKGFAALHFSIFRSAVQAHLEVVVYHREGSECAVFGSICAGYKGLDYSTQYKKNLYSIVFYKKGREDLQVDSSIPPGREDLQVNGSIPPGREDLQVNGSIPPVREDLMQKDADDSIPFSRFLLPLSRSSFVVPSCTSSVFYLDLTIGTESLTCKMDVASNRSRIDVVGEKCKVEFVFEWSKVK